MLFSVIVWRHIVGLQERRIKLVHDQLDQFRLFEVKLQAQLDVATKDVHPAGAKSNNARYV